MHRLNWHGRGRIGYPETGLVQFYLEWRAHFDHSEYLLTRRSDGAPVLWLVVEHSEPEYYRSLGVAYTKIPGRRSSI